ncbi:MAG: hypothetical protein ABFS56_14565 [Pseudomonadota bacterium]
MMCRGLRASFEDKSLDKAALVLENLNNIILSAVTYIAATTESNTEKSKDCEVLTFTLFILNYYPQKPIDFMSQLVLNLMALC